MSVVVRTALKLKGEGRRTTFAITMATYPDDEVEDDEDDLAATDFFALVLFCTLVALYDPKGDVISPR